MTSCGKYSKETSYGNSWEMFKIVPVNEKGEEIKLKLSGSYYLIGFFHETDINYCEDTSHVIVEYEKTKKRFKFKSMIKTDFEIDVIQKKLRSKTIDDYVEGSWSILSEDLPEKMNRLKNFLIKI